MTTSYSHNPLCKLWITFNTLSKGGENGREFY